MILAVTYGDEGGMTVLSPLRDATVRLTRAGVCAPDG